MAPKLPEPALQDIVDAIERIYGKMADISEETFHGDLDRRQIVERNFEIISEASRRLPDNLKDRNPT